MTTDDPTKPLRLIAFDTDDLSVISANLQDALIRVADMTYLPKERRFALAGERYDWIKAAAGGCERCATGLHFECVTNVSRSGFAQDQKDRALNLLAIHFEAGDVPGGTVRLTFSGNVVIRLDVECLEAQMHDLGPRRPCDKQPEHVIEAGNA